jgi:shikimate kinase / 3-dehydroquinate synthase
MSRPLVLAGFMGTGKTTAGRLCAERLGYDFVDADHEIERREGMSIPQVFERKGEPYFRQVEAALVRELIGRERVVIATGGGMIVDAANRRALLGAGVCVCLTASPDAILSRVDASTRPMLRGDDPRVRVATLLKERAPAYRDLHYFVDTSHASPRETADQVVALYRAEQIRIPVKVPGTSESAGHLSYDIIFGNGVMDQLGHALAGRGWAAPFAIVSDDVAGPLYAERARQALRCAGIDAFIHTMPAGESHKHLHTVEAMYRAFSEHGMERGSAVVAVGGGVVGDVSGFAAATYLRGVPFVQVPTSLLAMADSSIGGKVGVDTSFGKNLVGAFKQPELVAIDTSCLRTLPPVELRCGYAEIVKAGLIAGGDAYERIKRFKIRDWRLAAQDSNLKSPILQSLLDAIELKRAVVEEDPYEKGRRALLNLGHTFGHGIEAWSQFAIKHGEGVSLGLVCALRLSQALGLCPAELAREVVALLDGAGLPVALPEVDAGAIWQLMQSDKKKRAGKLRFVLLRGPGECFTTDAVGEADARRALETLAVVP